MVIGLLLLAALVTGSWQGNSGKRLHSPRQIEYRITLFTVIAVLGVSVMALFATCALLTAPQPKRVPWLTAHLIASVSAAIASAIMTRIFILNKP